MIIRIIKKLVIICCCIMLMAILFVITDNVVFSITLAIIITLNRERISRFWEKRSESRSLYRCEECNKFDAMQKEKSTFIKSEEISIKAETNIRDWRGRIVGTGEQYIPGTRSYYNDLYICKFCGAEKYIRRTYDEKHI